MLLLLAIALATEPLPLERGVAALGYDTDGALWVLSHPEVIRFVDGQPSGSFRANRLLADTAGPVITALGTELTIHDASPPRRLQLDISVGGLTRTADGGFAVRHGSEVVRFDAAGVELERATHGCDRGGALTTIGDDVWVPCIGGPWRWTAEGFVQQPYPERDTPWRIVDDRRVVDTTGAERAVLPGPVRPILHTDTRLLALRTQEPPADGRSLLWVDLTTGEVHHLDPRGAHFRNETTAVSPDGQIAAIATGQVVDFLDLEAGRWMSDTVMHRSRSELLTVSDDGQRALTGDHSGVRILWQRGGAPTLLPAPTWPQASSDIYLDVGPRVPHHAVFSPDGARLLSTFNGGVFTVHDGRTGALAWQGFADPETLGGPSYSFDVVPARRGPFCMTGEKRYLSRPAFSPDGAFLVTAGTHDRKSLLLVWDTSSGEVVQRYVFDDTALVLGFRSDGRMVVLAGDALFALHAGRGEIDPELVHANVASAWVRDGEVSWLEVGADRRRAPDAPRHEPEPRVALEDGRAVFR